MPFSGHASSNKNYNNKQYKHPQFKYTKITILNTQLQALLEALPASTVTLCTGPLVAAACDTVSPQVKKYPCVYTQNGWGDCARLLGSGKGHIA
jgi:hypothetical protein